MAECFINTIVVDPGIQGSDDQEKILERGYEIKRD